MKIPRETFEVIYKKLATPLTKFIAKRIGADSDAVEEVFSRTVVAAWKGFKTFRHKSSYFTWLCRIALNKIADYYRDQVNERSIFIVPTLKEIANIESNNASPDENLALKELCDAVNGCLNLLPYEKRRLLHLRYWRDLSIKQIAIVSGTSERSVEGKLYRARKSLEIIFTKEKLNFQDA